MRDRPIHIPAFESPAGFPWRLLIVPALFIAVLIALALVLKGS
jgi:hypothetical protein